MYLVYQFLQYYSNLEDSVCQIELVLLFENEIFIMFFNCDNTVVAIVLISLLSFFTSFITTFITTALINIFISVFKNTIHNQIVFFVYLF